MQMGFVCLFHNLWGKPGIGNVDGSLESRGFVALIPFTEQLSILHKY